MSLKEIITEVFSAETKALKESIIELNDKLDEMSEELKQLREEIK